MSTIKVAVFGALGRMGSETSALYDNLKWASEVKRVLDNGLNDTLHELHDTRIRCAPHKPPATRLVIQAAIPYA